MLNSNGQLRPNDNVGNNVQGWAPAFTVTHTSSVALTLNVVVLDCFTFTSSNTYQGGGATRGFNLTLTYGANRLSTGDFGINGAGNLHPADGHGLVKFELAEGYTLGPGQQPDFSLAANRSSMETHGCFLGDNNIKVKGTPEPATATLSLLALAGLASRRRCH